MKLDAFVAILETRIPTPQEFVAFAHAQGWKFTVSGTNAGLVVPDRTDPFALSFAKTLSREPYRTNVLKHLALLAPAEPEPVPLPPIEQEPEPAEVEPESTSQVNCRTCGKDVTDPDTRARMADALFCPNSGKAFPTTTDAHGVIHEGSKACPYKG